MLKTTKIISPFIKDFLLSHGYSDESCVEAAGSAGSGRLYYRIKEYKRSSILQVNATVNEDFKNFVSFGKYFLTVLGSKFRYSAIATAFHFPFFLRNILSASNPKYAFVVVMEKGSRHNLKGAAFAARGTIEWMRDNTEYTKDSRQ